MSTTMKTTSQKLSVPQQQQQLIENSIIDLRSSSCSSSSASTSDFSTPLTSEDSINNTESVLLEIIRGLSSVEKIVPGSNPQDAIYAYRKKIPTLVLYDNLGLELYDQITATPDYYPYENELKILKTHGAEIARRISGLTDAEVETGADLDSTNSFKGLHPEPSQSMTGEFSGGFADGRCASLSAPREVYLSIVELGAGSLKKTVHLLRNVAHILGKPQLGKGVCLSQAEYYALDLEYGQLVSTLSAIQLQENSGAGPTVGEEVQTRGICGTYSQGLDWLTRYLAAPDSRGSRPDSPETERSTVGDKDHRRAMLWLGSSIGNFSPSEALAFLKNEVGPALHHQTRILIGIDNCKIPEKVQRAYDDSDGVTRQFVLNGIAVVARALGAENALSPSQFDYVSRYNTSMSRNEAYLRAREDIDFTTPAIETAGGELQKEMTIHIDAGELVSMERSYKYTDEEAHQLFHSAGLRVIQSWSDQSHLPSSERLVSGPNHTLYLVERPEFSFSKVNHPKSNPLSVPAPTKAAPPDTAIEVAQTELEGRLYKGNMPSLVDWMELWKAWDLVTMRVIPQDLLYSKPINLRHICLFYLGHIPVFADMQLSRHFQVPYSEPRIFSEIFERGIDPNMEDPNQCHDHSKVPDHEDEWPSLEEILKFRDSLRARISNVYESIGASESDGHSLILTRSLARVLWMIYEHEAMHLETLLYMLVQMPSLNLPPSFTLPDWTSLSRQWDLEAAGPSDDLTNALIEYPKEIVLSVGHDDLEADDDRLSFSVDHEFGWDIEHPVRLEVVGPFKLSPKPISNREYLVYLLDTLPAGARLEAKDVPASWDYTFSSDKSSHEVKIRTMYGLVPFSVGQHWPVQGSGRQLEAYARVCGGRLPSANELRVYLRDNPPGGPMSPIGFQNWHPVPARAPVKDSDGTWRGGMNGGVWEWTGTLFERFEGFQASSIYRGYSSDFFDGLHWTLVGASWATVPQIAQRKSFVNWYQANYPYVFAGARVAYDY